MRLSAGDYKGVLDIINFAYEANGMDAMLTAVYGKIEKLIGIDSAIFVPAVEIAAVSTGASVKTPFLYNAPKKLMDIFTAHYVRHSPYVTSGYIHKVRNRAATADDFMSTDTLRKNKPYNDWLRLSGHRHPLCGMLASQGDLVGVVSFDKGRRYSGFTEREKAIVNHVLPHLARAIHASALIGVGQEAGVIVTGRDGAIIQMNGTAKTALDGLPVRSLPEAGLDSKSALLRTEKGAWRVRTAFAHNRDEKIILLEPLTAGGRKMPDLVRFGLTKRQEEVVRLVVRGLSNREIAQQLYIEEQTIKDHLRDVFEKTKVKRRSELMAKILGGNG